MATSPVAAALALPHVVAAVDSFNELLPGVAASAENLQPMWEHLSALLPREKYICREEPCEIRIVERNVSKGGCSRQMLEVAVLGPAEASVPLRLVDCHDTVWRKKIAIAQFEWDLDGFAAALAWAKDLANRARQGEFCERCRTDFVPDTCDYPVRRLRARPLPMCAECALEMALGAPPEKRARRK